MKLNIQALERKLIVKNWALRLNGKAVYREELTKEEEAEAAKDNIVVAFCYSDDLLEFRGAIYEEAGAWTGTSIGIKKGGALCCVEESANHVTAIWCPDNKPVCMSWKITANFEHESFFVFEDDRVFCSGIVFAEQSLLS